MCSIRAAGDGSMTWHMLQGLDISTWKYLYCILSIIQTKYLFTTFDIEIEELAAS